MVGQSRNLLKITPPFFAVDSYEFAALDESITVGAVATEAEYMKKAPTGASDALTEKIRTDNIAVRAGMNNIYEHKPHFHEWATALPGEH